jgi:hypothetical protein
MGRELTGSRDNPSDKGKPTVYEAAVLRSLGRVLRDNSGEYASGSHIDQAARHSKLAFLLGISELKVAQVWSGSIKEDLAAGTEHRLRSAEKKMKVAAEAVGLNLDKLLRTSDLF